MAWISYPLAWISYPLVSLCADPDIQELTWQAYMYKRLVKAKPMAHLRIFFKDMAHLLGIVAPWQKAASPNSAKQ
ncbi:MAG: hypothetical protein N838_15410 [Thiohalocapsa sp. PB-PSB1]|nr:MAG: hypothetical protein N838_15410 [Thiohalocapsa sp. PB-PSB1]